MRKAIIGITADYSTKETYSKYPWYALREHYVKSLTDLGAIALILPHDLNAVQSYCEMIDGLVITGGDFDINPKYYGAQPYADTMKFLEGRTSFEMQIFKQAYEKKMPIMGICGGMQLINVALGGGLIQHIPDSVSDCLAHEQPNPRHQTSHGINIKHGSILFEVIGKDSIQVNSAHHQAVEKLGDGVTATAIAVDGVVEAIEVAGHPFCFGAQWHPEILCTEDDHKLMQHFINMCVKK